ncbi:MAG: UvrD-helicase domain-containing protein [Pseudomonadota bacterium]
MIHAPPGDQDARNEAMDPKRSFIVQAPAGSGKTGLLVRRFLKLLTTVDNPEQILAITFTRKATAEMRQRIISALSGLTSEGEPLTDPEMVRLSTDVLNHAKRKGWDLRAHSRRLRIQTIDSLCTELVRRMPWSARFGSVPAIAENSEEMRMQAAKQTLMHMDRPKSSWRDDCIELLRLTDGRLDQCHRLLTEMLDSRTKWLSVLRQNGEDRASFERNWQTVINRLLVEASQQIEPAVRDQLTRLCAFAAEQLDASGTAHPLTACAGMSEFPAPDYRQLPLWRGVVSLLFTTEPALRKPKGVNKRLGFPREAADEKQRLAAVLEWFSEHPEATTALQVVSRLPDGCFSDTQWNYLRALYRLLPVAAAELQLQFKQFNTADFSEIALRADEALGGEDNPSDLALMFDYELKHILVDEFQDTSASQVGLIQKLTRGWQADDGRTLFLVGDPMQSIYLFRQAEVSHFLKVQQRGLGDLVIHPLFLTANFRSSVTLVEWFNKVFKQVLPLEEDIEQGAIQYAEAEPVLETTGDSKIVINPLLNDAAVSEAEHIAESIARTTEQYPDRTIAVLARARSHLAPVAESLRNLGVTFQAIDLESLDTTQHVQDLVTLTRALQQPGDRTAWLGLLRSPFVGLDLTDITRLAEHDWITPIWALMKDPSVKDRLSEDGKIRIDKLLPVVQSALNQFRRLPLRRVVEGAWLRLVGPALLTEPELDDCLAYLDQLESLETDFQIPTPVQIQNRVEQLWAKPVCESRIQLMTIHKAKGLEFDHVYLTSLERRTKGNDQELLRWIRMPDSLLLAAKPDRRDRDNRFFGYLGELHKTLATNEARRLLYVACTRARKRLFIFPTVSVDSDGDIGTPVKGSLLELLWPAIGNDADNPAEPAHNSVTADDDDLIDEETQYCLPRHPANDLTIDISPSLRFKSEDIRTTDEIEFSWASEIARVVGIIVHHEFQQVDALGWDIWSQSTIDDAVRRRWTDLLIAHGLSDQPLALALEQIEAAVRSARSDPRAKWIFAPQHRAVQSEWALSTYDNDRFLHLVIDRSFIDTDNIRWIIDFKSSRHDEEDIDFFLDREQERYDSKMQQYATAVSALDPEHEVKLGLYYPVLHGWREWSPGA